ncbi:MAG: RsmB/NOP family class I SAM-dependent RNA methyltransferase [Candidatus Bathyarchaeia archaeon]
MIRDALAVAIEALSWIELERLSAQAAFQRAARQLQVTDRESLGFAYRQVFETVRRLNLLDRIAEKTVGKAKYAALPLGVKALLRILAYESAVEERRSEASRYIEAAREVLGWQTLHPVEEDLGRLLRTEAASVFRDLPEGEGMSLRFCVPRWLVGYLYRLLGRPESLRFLSGLSTSPPTYVRLNPIRARGGSAAELLERSGFSLVEVPSVRGLYKASGGELPVVESGAFKEGLARVEDLSVAYAVENLGVKEGARVLEVSTGPEAMTAHISELMGNKGLICSLHLSRGRTRLWKMEIARSGVQNAELVLGGPGSVPSDAEFDVVVVRPPCSRIGLWGRNPSDRWTSSLEAVLRLARTQWQILESCAEHVRTLGVLLYFTNTVTVEENEDNIRRLLRYYPEFKLTELKPQLGSRGLRGLTTCRRLYPHRDECYGSFLAKLLREG